MQLQQFTQPNYGIFVIIHAIIDPAVHKATIAGIRLYYIDRCRLAPTLIPAGSIACQKRRSWKSIRS